MGAHRCRRTGRPEERVRPFRSIRTEMFREDMTEQAAIEERLWRGVRLEGEGRREVMLASHQEVEGDREKRWMLKCCGDAVRCWIRPRRRVETG